MTAKNLPAIVAEITFLPREGDNNLVIPGSRYERYAPHLVVQSPDIRESRIGEDYLGVGIVGFPSVYTMGEPSWFTLALLYEVNYDALIPEATFTVRRGPFVVGYGKVLTRGNSCDEAEELALTC